MFNYEILRYKWLIGGVGGGLAILLLAVLTYLPMWGPRQEKESGDVGPASPWRDTLRYIPAVLVLTWVGSVVYALVHAYILRQE